MPSSADKGKIIWRFEESAVGTALSAAQGQETREKRSELAELRHKEEACFKVGLFAEKTPRTRGQKPNMD